MIKGKASLICTMPTGDGWDGFMNIEVHDEMSGARFLELKVPYADMMRALTARQAEVEFVLRPAVVGMRREHKTEVVPVPRSLSSKDADGINAVLAPYEVDGWRGYRSDVTNHHRWVGPEKDGLKPTRVSFVRHVPVERGEAHQGDES